MRRKRRSIGLRTASAVFAVTLLVTSTWAAPREKVLYSFNFNDGYIPSATLIFDAAGNLYGTTANGGGEACDAYGCGLVFELTLQAGGGWAEKVLYNFNNRATDGHIPYSGVIFDASGNLYGTTRQGGLYGCGTVFELTPTAGAGWREKILHQFNSNGKDGCKPYGNVILDASGNLYGTTSGGGAYGWGTAYELSPQAGGAWKEKLLHTFGSTKTDGWVPLAGLIFDGAGNLYGTTELGAALEPDAGGTVFQLSPRADGSWKETRLASFRGLGFGPGPDYPWASLIFDGAGNLYGTSNSGGSHTDGGTVFELSPKTGGGWTRRVLHSFNTEVGDGWAPTAGVIFDAAGNFYGTTDSGGISNESFGTVFKLTPHAGRAWTETILYSFSNINTIYGDTPYGGLILDAAGNLYGTTFYGGTYGSGTVFEITP